MEHLFQSISIINPRSFTEANEYLLLLLMNLFFIVFTLHATLFTKAQAANIQRINYLPEQFFEMSFSFEQQKKSNISQSDNIKWSQSEIQKYSASFGRKISKYILLGGELEAESFSGIDLMRGNLDDQESRTAGLSKFKLWSIFRLREQSGETSLWDWFLSFSPRLGDAKVGARIGNRQIGGHGIHTGFANGYLILPWEFRFSVFFEQLSRREIQSFNQNLEISPYYKYGFSFQTQYSFSQLNHLLFEVSVFQESIQRFKTNSFVKELQLGSRSKFDLGYKKMLTPFQLIYFGISTSVGEYYIKNQQSIEGNLMFNSVFLKWAAEF